MRKSIIGFCLLSLSFLGVGSLGAEERYSDKNKGNCDCHDEDVCEYHRSHHCSDHGNCPATRLVGFASGATLEEQEVVIQGKLIEDPAIPVTLPLYNAEVSRGAPFTFTPYFQSTGLGGFFTVTNSGKYLLQYGLNGIPSNGMATTMLSTITGQTPIVSWIGIKVVRDTTEHFYGAVPFSLLISQNSDPQQVLDIGSTAEKSLYCCSGFGQIALPLQCGDQVSLQLYLGLQYPPSEFNLEDVKLFIGSNEFVYPATPVASLPGISRGPTLTIEKIGDCIPGIGRP